jgi:hypothetical protein
VADQEGPFPDRALSELIYEGEKGRLTAALVVQAAAALLFIKGLVKKLGGGFLIPALLGKPYIERLQGVGVEIESSLL